MVYKVIIYTFFAIIAISGNVFAGEVAAPLAPAPLAAPAAIGYTNTIPYNIPPFAGRADLVLRGLSAAPAPLIASPHHVAAPLAAAPLAAGPGLYTSGFLGPSAASLPYGGASALLSAGPGLFSAGPGLLSAGPGLLGAGPGLLSAGPGLLNAPSPYAGLFAPGLYSGLSPALAYNGAYAASPYGALPAGALIKK